MMKVIIAVSAVLCACVLSVQGKVACRIKGSGILKTFGRDKGYVRLPCKYLASESNCRGYNIKVSPGQAFDSRKNYFTDTVWIIVKEIATGNVWNGRTATRRVSRYFSGNETEPFVVKENTLAAKMVGNYKKYMVSVKQKDKNGWRVNFYGYDEKVRTRRRNAGIEIICPDGEFENKEGYPTSMCANTTQTAVFHDSKRALGLDNPVEALLYDQLTSNAVHTQNHPQCAAAFDAFDSCPIDKVQALKACHELVTSKKTIQCVNRFYNEPMDVFVHCLKYVCTGDAESCNSFKDAMEGCKPVEGLPTECPASP